MPFEPRLSATAPIRVLLVDDSAVALLLLQRMLRTSPEMEIVGTARDGRDALGLLQVARPDVIVTDYHMPQMDGLELVRHIMADSPCPILVVSSVAASDQSAMFSLLAAGAVDVFPKPEGLDCFEAVAALLVQKIKLLSGVPVISRPFTPLRPAQVLASAPDPAIALGAALGAASGAARARNYASVAPAAEATEADSALRAQETALAPRRGFSGRMVSASVIPRATQGVQVVAIGASTGGPQTLREILGALPANFPAPILCVQHISLGFLHGMVQWIDEGCHLKVRVAAEGEQAAPGTVYFAPEGCHLEINGQGRLLYSAAPPLGGHRPAVDALFASTARHIGARAVGVLLTGMGSDGADGLLEMARAGASTVAQDEATSVVFGMPRQAIAIGAAQWILPALQIAQALERLAVSRQS